MTSGSLQVRDGASIAYWLEGDLDADLTVVMAHGWTLDHRIWDPIVSELGSDRGRTVRVLRYDARGHGRSTPGPANSATLEALAADLRELISAVAPSGSLILAGHSMGGMTLMALADLDPELIASRVVGAAFVATSPGPFLSPLTRIPGFLAITLAVLKLSGAFQARMPKAALRLGARYSLFGDRAERRFVASVGDQMLMVDSDTLANCGVTILRHNRSKSLAVFRDVPTKVFSGGRDLLTPPSHGRRISAQIPGSTFILYPGASHMLSYERHESVTEELSALIGLASSNSGLESLIA